MKTIRIDSKMLDLLQKHRNKNSQISNELKEILDDGLIFINNCLLLKSFYDANRDHLKLSYFNFDYIDYEVAINGFHIDDFSDKNYLEQGILFIKEIENKILEKYQNIEVELILAKTNYGYHFTMHTIREKNNYLVDDIEKYETATLIIRHTYSNI